MGNLGHLTWVRLQQLQRAAPQIPTSACSTFMGPNNGMAASAWDFWHAHRCRCMGLHMGDVPTQWREFTLKVLENPLPRWGVKPASALCLAFLMPCWLSHTLLKHPHSLLWKLGASIVKEKQTKTITAKTSSAHTQTLSTHRKCLIMHASSKHAT